MFEFDVLGPLTVTHDGLPVPLGPALRQIVAGLVSAYGAPVTSLRLADFLYGEDGANTALVNIRSHISHLRGKLTVTGAQGTRTLGRDLVPTRDRRGETAYQLVIAPESLDVHRFEHQVAQGRRELLDHDYHAAMGSFTGALRLWRGQPFTELADKGLLLAEVARLENLQHVARAGRAEAGLGAGYHHEVAADLAALVEEHPEHGGLHGLYIRCLDRCGRKIEAARAAQRAVTVALDNGIEDARLARLQQNLLRGTLHPATSIGA